MSHSEHPPEHPPEYPPEQPGNAPEADDAAKRRRLRGFLNHLIAYFAVMVVLVPINAVLDPGYPWFLFPLVAWGAPLAVHAAYVMGWWGRKNGTEIRNG